MPAGSDNKYPKLILEEVADDGSATVTPAADHRALFLGEDGLLHLKDSAGSVTTPGGGVSAGAITGSGLTMATNRLLGRTTASSGAIEEITVGSGLSLSGGSLTATGGTTIIRGRVNGDGTIAAGTGFSITRTATGRYTITFTSAFSAVPVVLLTPRAGAGGATAATAVIDNFNAAPTTTSTRVFILSAGTYTDLEWDFMAIAP